jgi:N,N'-diacetyllegionaminate synthase
MNLNNFKKLNKTYIIAEIGNNHEGNLKLAKKLIKLAAKSGADAVKFQTYKTEKFINIANRKRFNQLKKFELTQSNFLELKKYALEKKIHFISTPFDIQSADFLKKNLKVIKIASGDNNFFPLIERLLDKKKKLIISTGLTNAKDIIFLKKFLYNILGKQIAHKNIALLHCVTSYPVPNELANLNSISFLKRKNDFCIGYSDHTIGIEACLAAVALGAKIIEKHFTIDKNFSNFRDHKLSSDFKEFKKMVLSIRKIEKMLGTEDKKIQFSEKHLIKQIRRSIFATKNIKKGNYLKINELDFLRENRTQKFMDLFNIQKKRIKINFKKNHLIKKEHLY